MLDETHDPQRRSWVESSRDAATDFPIQNLPWCVFSNPGETTTTIGVGIGNHVLDLREVIQSDVLRDQGLAPDVTAALDADTLNSLMACSPEDRQAVRQVLSWLLEESCGRLRDDQTLQRRALRPINELQLHLPATIGDYTDFYASLFHANNVGTMLRPEQPLFPNYKWLPVAYHGRASSIVASGHPIHRPRGQTPPAVEGNSPLFQPTKALDYEMEIGVWIAEGNALGTSIAIENAERHIFGICLLNDWSARDIQRWEYQPLGPFLAKNFMTSVSPWIVTREALAPYRAAASGRMPGDPAPLPHMYSADNAAHGGISLDVEVHMSSRGMRGAGMPDLLLSKGNFCDMYWTIAQMIAHHTSNGCNLRPGDLIGSGTVSGRDRKSRGCLLELTWDGDIERPMPGSQKTPIELPTGEKRFFLADGDMLTLTGYCQREGYVRIGLGSCTGTIQE